MAQNFSRPGRVAATAAALALTGFVLGCGGGSGSSAGPATVADLEGRSFVSTEVEGHELVEGTSVSLTFGKGGVGASAGCNQLAGSYDGEAGSLRLDMGGSTKMACSPEQTRQDRWLASFLDSEFEATLDGSTLTLTAGDGTSVTLREGGGRTDGELTGRSWKLAHIVSARGEMLAPAPHSRKPTVEFQDDGWAEINSGCNRGGAAYAVDGDGFIEFGELGLERNKCNRLEKLNQKFVTEIMQGRVAYSFEGADDSLVITRGGHSLVFSAE